MEWICYKLISLKHIFKKFLNFKRWFWLREKGL
jgi:hypothetical protein